MITATLRGDGLPLWCKVKDYQAFPRFHWLEADAPIAQGTWKLMADTVALFTSEDFQLMRWDLKPGFEVTPATTPSGDWQHSELSPKELRALAEKCARWHVSFERDAEGRLAATAIYNLADLLEAQAEKRKDFGYCFPRYVTWTDFQMMLYAKHERPLAGGGILLSMDLMDAYKAVVTLARATSDSEHVMSAIAKVDQLSKLPIIE
jgi:hypothetical protein